MGPHEHLGKKGDLTRRVRCGRRVHCKAEVGQKGPWT